jgi:hypothetical protein
VAVEPIDFKGVRAFQPGDPVPDESVKANGWEDLVKPVDESAEDAPAIPPATPAAAAKKPGSGSRGASSGN